MVAPNSNKVLNLVQPKAENAPEEIENGTEKTPNSFTKNNLVKKEPSKAQAVAAIKKGQEMLAVKEKLKKNQEEQRKEALKLTQNLRKRKQELLEKQLAQQKVLIEKLEKSNFLNDFVQIVCSNHYSFSSRRSPTGHPKTDHKENARCHRGDQQRDAGADGSSCESRSEEQRRDAKGDVGRRVGPHYEAAGGRRHVRNTEKVDGIEGENRDDQGKRERQEIQSDR